jgi:hypothetical protein
MGNFQPIKSVTNSFSSPESCEGDYTNINGQSFPKKIDRSGAVASGKKKAAKRHRKKVKRAIDDEIEKLRDSNLPANKAQKKIDELKHRRKKLMKKPGGAVAKQYNKAVDKLEEAKEVRTNDVPPEAEKPRASAKHTLDGPQGSSGGKDGKKAEHTDAFKNFEPKRLMNQMLDDPEAAKEKLSKMNMQEMSTAMQMMQTQMQQIQRMTQLQSSLAKAQHKTASSVIRNI